LVDPRDHIGRQRAGFGGGNAFGGSARFLVPNTSVTRLGRAVYRLLPLKVVS